MLEYMLTAVALILGAWYLYEYLRGRRTAAAVSDEREMGRLVSQELNEHAHELLVLREQQLIRTQNELQLLRDRCEQLTKLANTHITQNENFEKQRNQIFEMYRISGLQASNGQQWLMDVLQRTQLQLNAYREKEGKPPVHVEPALVQAVETFKKEHGDVQEVAFRG